MLVLSGRGMRQEYMASIASAQSMIKKPHPKLHTFLLIRLLLFSAAMVAP